MSEGRAAVRPVVAETITDWRDTLRTLGNEDPGTVSAAALADQLRALEELKAAAAAAQARVTVAFVAEQRAAQVAAGVPAARVGRGIAAQVALARRDSPAKGSRHVGLAQALVSEMPRTLAAFERGVLSEWRVTLLVRETACLSREDRIRADAELAARPGGLAALSDRDAVSETRAIAYRLDPYSFTERARRAAADRHVSIRPAPDTMAMVTGLLPAAQGVAAHAALVRHAEALRAGGDPRSRGQIMADTFVERLTGQASADAVPVEVNLVMTDQALLGTSADSDPGTEPEPDLGSAPAWLDGYGPLPAPLAADLLADTDAAVWLRRLYTSPGTGTLAAMDSRRRRFPRRLRRFLVLRDRRCRTPWCGAPIRHHDHIVPAGAGGRTAAENGQGLCEACNHAKQAPGWRQRAHPDGSIVTRTPTGHSYLSRAPALHPAPSPRIAGLGPRRSRLEISFRDLLRTA
ncbi:MAG: DUF222 domain-containing protein [Nocardioidaceae bacterium]